ncbi:MAG: hypothetical protein GX249_02245 [Firmicutes bacterium]|nr:hypothetical protein [Bacillota bacterium]
MTTIWLALFFSLMSSIQPYETTRYEGLIAQSTPWDCASAAAASLFVLASESDQPRLPVEEMKGASLSALSKYFTDRGWETIAYKLTWPQILYFFEHWPHRPLLAHRHLEEGHYVVLLGLVDELLVVANPSSGVQAVDPQDFLADFSGFTLYFPNLPALSTVEKILTSAEQRLKLLKYSVAEL